MNEATQPMKLAIGAESLIVPYLERDGIDEVQLITADGQHFALIQQSPAWENADLIVKAVNARDALVAALTLIAYRYESGDIGDLINDMPEIEAALKAAK
jgi:hypothetical protein